MHKRDGRAAVVAARERFGVNLRRVVRVDDEALDAEREQRVHRAAEHRLSSERQQRFRTVLGQRPQARPQPGPEQKRRLREIGVCGRI